MGMECELRRVSEFELTVFRKNPTKLYSDPAFLSPATSDEFKSFTSTMLDVQNSEVGRRIQARAMNRQAPSPEDLEGYRREMEDVMNRFSGMAESIAEHAPGLMPGLSKDKRQLNLHKSWSCLHYMFTGKAWESDDTPLGKAILGGAEIPDVNGVMGYGPVRYLLPSEVRQVGESLREFPIDVKARAYDPLQAKAQRVYVPDHGIEELTAYFRDLRELYELAAQSGDSMLAWIR